MKRSLAKYIHNLYRLRNTELQYLYQTIFPVYFRSYCHITDMMSHKPALKFSSISNIISLQVWWTGEFDNSFRFLIPFFRIHLWIETSIFPPKRKIVADYPKYSETTKSSNWRSFTYKFDELETDGVDWELIKTKTSVKLNDCLRQSEF